MLHVLIVDDSPIVCQLLSIELSQFDIEVSTADSIEEGVRCVQGDPSIDVVMLDLSVAETQGGRAVLERFARDGGALPVILQSAISDEELSDRRDTLGAQGYFRKGSDLVGLVSQLRQLSA